MAKKRFDPSSHLLITMSFAFVFIGFLFAATCALKPDWVKWHILHRPNTAMLLLRTHPRLQAVCDDVGGCENVRVTCTRYDGTGNTILVNTTYWVIRAGGVMGEGYYPNNHPSPDAAIEDALTNYLAVWWATKDDDIDQKKIVYPNSTDCKEDCGDLK